MLVSLYIIFELVLVLTFFFAFFLKKDMLWLMAIVLSALLMVSAFNVENYSYEYNDTSGNYEQEVQTNSFPYLMGVNLMFFALSLLLFIFDLFESVGVDGIGGKVKSFFSKGRGN